MIDPNKLILEIMTVDPIVVSPYTLLNKVKRIFLENSFHHLPVVEDGKVVGIISKTDMLIYYKELSKETTGKKYTLLSNCFTQASDIMSEGLVKLKSEDTIGIAVDIFMANIFHCIPIEENGKLLGIVTSHDIIGYAFKKSVLN